MILLKDYVVFSVKKSYMRVMSRFLVFYDEWFFWIFKEKYYIMYMKG